MPDLDLSITICSWNTRKDLRECLSSLEKCKSETQFEVIVFDNASEDESGKMVENEFPWAKLIQSNHNLGFGKGQNLAMEAASGRYLMPLNSDTLVHSGALSEIVKFMDTHSEVGILGPKLLNPDGSLQFSCRKFPTPLAALFRNTPLGKLFPKNRFSREYLMQDWNHDDAREVDWVSGAAICINRECYHTIGGFDEQFFMFLEDVDWCKRAWQAGFKVMYFPKAVITHSIGKSTDRIANPMIVQFHDSMMLYYQKHHLSKMNLFVRPFAFGFAKLFLWLRQSTFLTKNKIDDWKRRTGRL